MSGIFDERILEPTQDRKGICVDGMVIPGHTTVHILAVLLFHRGHTPLPDFTTTEYACNMCCQ